MGEERVPIVSFRVSAERYEQLKTCADAQGESVNALARRVVEEYVTGSQPAPSPGPSPGPQPPAESPGEIRELRERVRKLEEGGAEVQGYLQGVHEKLNSLGLRLSITEAHLGIPPEMPGWPRGYKAGGRGKRRKSLEKPKRKNAKK